MTKTEAVKKAFTETSYCGSHRVRTFIETLDRLGFTIRPKKKVVFRRK